MFIKMDFSLIFHVIKVIVIGIPFNIWDATSDIQAAQYHFSPKLVNRTINHCEGFNCTFEVEEVDIAWGCITAILVQWPILILLSFSVMDALKNKQYCTATLIPLLCVLPYPLVVLGFQVAFLFNHGSTNLEFVTVGLLALEAYAEASPQSGVQSYILLSDGERTFDNSVYYALLSSIITVSKGSGELFTYANQIKDSEDLPLTAGHPCYVKMFISQIKFLPTFVTSYIFRGVSTVVVFTFFKEFAVIHLFVSVCIVTILTARSSKDEVWGGVVGGVFHGLAGIMVLPKFPFATREKEKKPMLVSSLAWFALNTTTLIIIPSMVAAGPNFHLPHWSNKAKFPIMANPNYIFFSFAILILMGILSLFVFHFQVYSVDWKAENAKSKERLEKEEKEKKKSKDAKEGGQEMTQFIDSGEKAQDEETHEDTQENQNEDGRAEQEPKFDNEKKSAKNKENELNIEDEKKKSAKSTKEEEDEPNIEDEENKFTKEEEDEREEPNIEDEEKKSAKSTKDEEDDPNIEDEKKKSAKEKEDERVAPNIEDEEKKSNKEKENEREEPNIEESVLYSLLSLSLKHDKDLHY